MLSFKGPLRPFVAFIYGLLFLKSPCYHFHRWTRPQEEETEVSPTWLQLNCTFCIDTLPSPWLGSPSHACLQHFRGCTKNCSPSACSISADLPGHRVDGPQCHRMDTSRLGKQLLLVLLPSQKDSHRSHPHLQEVEPSRCSKSRWDKVAGCSFHGCTMPRLPWTFPTSLQAWDQRWLCMAAHRPRLETICPPQHTQHFKCSGVHRQLVLTRSCQLLWGLN